MEMKMKNINDKCSKGEATVDIVTVKQQKYIAVGILNTKMIIALCGEVGAEDEVESWANAIKIATLWNESNKPA